MTRRILLAGCGYIGAQLALLEKHAGTQIEAFVRSERSVSSLAEKKMTAEILDLDTPLAVSPSQTKATDCLYYFVPPPPAGQTDRRSENFIRHVMAQNRPKQIVLISTTGVYGDCGGRWIDESEAPKPYAGRARRRLDAERQWRSWADMNKVPLTILRVAGIYGPGKLPEARLRRAEPVLAENESPWSNRIYSKDLVSICFQAGRAGYDGVLNAVDGNPTTMTDYFFRVADFLGLPRPAEISMSDAEGALSAGMLSYLQESKRIRNNRLTEALGIQPEYPTLQAGLADMAQALASSPSSAEKI